jgi:hypothetical protein
MMITRAQKLLSRVAAVGFLTATLAACAGPRASVRAEKVSSTGSPAQSYTGEGYRLAMLATGCWYGGVWSEAEGVAIAKRRAVDRDRCEQVVARVYGRSSRARYLQLRAFEPSVVDDLVSRVESLAVADPADAHHVGALSDLLRAVADAQRENMHARRTADRIKMDLAGTRHSVLAVDERAAVAPLREHQGLVNLLALRAGELSKDAHALGVLAALDRMELARGLPKHLKVIAVEDVYSLLFGSGPPSVPEDPTVPLEGGVWLSYLARTAAAAGFPVPSSIADLRERNTLAWAGVLEGFGARLRVDLPSLSSTATTTLRPILRHVVDEIDALSRTAHATVAPKV